ncbi:MAG: 1,4-dihydroxy-2-naphthoate polyprenyltransferase [Bacteroidetes bacterium]|nr:1,4-dihydroxy-2-naphthoate polyprenyltransferase [Bacteroidota bacterium]
MTSVSAWLVAFRLRTLPLALSTIFLGSFLAAAHHSFHWLIFIYAILTTIFLQILSNLANDYGDTVSGVDNIERIGPKRSLQAGSISLKQMKFAIILFITLSLISGILLILESMSTMIWGYGMACFLVGIAAIIAALKYTMGKNPYGYAGLGDISVFVFFGLVGVIGAYFLQTHTFSLLEFLPAISIGCFSTGVLNLNNLRDRENDARFGKRTLVVQWGLATGKKYHAFLLILGMLTALAYSLSLNSSVWKWIYLLSFIGIIRSIKVVFQNSNPASLDPELKRLALTTLLFSILFGVGLLL